MGRIFCSYFAQIKIEEKREENKMYKSMKQPVRKWKGHSLLKWAEDYVLVDIETSRRPRVLGRQIPTTTPWLT